jgi:hypothetical protein
MSTTPIIRGFIATLVVCMVAAVNAACTTSSSPAPCFVGAPGCPSSGLGPTPVPIFTTFTVPAGDTEPIPAFGTTWDVLSVTTNRTGPPGSTYTNIGITLTFLQANAFASLPVPGGSIGASGTQLGIEIGFDADQNNSTGTTLICNGFTYGTGFDHAIDGGNILNRLADGNFAVTTIPAVVMTGEAAVSGSGNIVIISVPISALGGTGQTNMVVGILNSSGANPVTDCVPDASVIQT